MTIEGHLEYLKASLYRMEERAISAEKRADLESVTLENTEKRIEKPTKTIEFLIDASMVEDLKNQIIEIKSMHDYSLETNMRIRQYGKRINAYHVLISICRHMKVSVSDFFENCFQSWNVAVQIRHTCSH